MPSPLRVPRTRREVRGQALPIRRRVGQRSATSFAPRGPWRATALARLYARATTAVRRRGASGHPCPDRLGPLGSPPMFPLRAAIHTMGQFGRKAAAPNPSRLRHFPQDGPRKRCADDRAVHPGAWPWPSSPDRRAKTSAVPAPKRHPNHDLSLSHHQGPRGTGGEARRRAKAPLGSASDQAVFGTGQRNLQPLSPELQQCARPPPVHSLPPPATARPAWEIPAPTRAADHPRERGTADRQTATKGATRRHRTVAAAPRSRSAAATRPRWAMPGKCRTSARGLPANGCPHSARQGSPESPASSPPRCLMKLSRHHATERRPAAP